MIKLCSVCEEPLWDGEGVIAVVRATYRQIPSSSSYAIDQPTECLEIMHSKCDEGDYGDETQN